MTTLESVRAKVIEAVPEITHRTEIVVGPRGGLAIQTFHNTITLADVLRAIGNMLVMVDCWGNFYHMKMKMSDKLPTFDKEAGSVRWNLSLPLDEQQPEVIEFLAKILN